MTNSKDKIKYVVTEGGEVLGVEWRLAKKGERYLFAGRTETVFQSGTLVEVPVVTPISPPPFVDREVVEPAIEAARDLVERSRNLNEVDMPARLWQKHHYAVYAAEEALHPKPKERWEVGVDSLERHFVRDTQGDEEFEVSSVDADRLAAKLNAQEGDAS